MFCDQKKVFSILLFLINWNGQNTICYNLNAPLLIDEKVQTTLEGDILSTKNDILCYFLFRLRPFRDSKIFSWVSSNADYQCWSWCYQWTVCRNLHQEPKRNFFEWRLNNIIFPHIPSVVKTLTPTLASGLFEDQWS